MEPCFVDRKASVMYLMLLTTEEEAKPLPEPQGPRNLAHVSVAASVGNHRHESHPKHVATPCPGGLLDG